MSARCDHGVPATRTCGACFEYGLVFWEEQRRRERRLAAVRAMLRALLPAPGVVQELCCAIHRLRHHRLHDMATVGAELRAMGPMIASLLPARIDLDGAAENIAAEIERAERRGYIRRAADDRATCPRNNQPRSALGPGEARCDDDERESEPDEQRRVAVTRGRGGARAPHGGEEGALDEAG